jgi:glutamate carboxypeptidase
MVLAQMRARRQEMLDALDVLVTAESPSDDRASLAACATVVGDIGGRLLGMPPEQVVVDGCPHLRWQFGPATDVLLLGHYDTVWPTGTISRWRFSVTDGVATGPGTFDMKAGIVQGLFALAALDDLDGVGMLLTGDEEIGSPSSRALIEETARDASATLVLEPSVEGDLKTGRHGVSHYAVQVTGRAAHAGLEPHLGVNALEELAHQILAIVEIARPDVATTVTPTVGHAGSAVNVVPAEALLRVDARVPTVDEQNRVDEAMRALTAVLPDATLTVGGGPNRPPLEPHLSQELFARTQALAETIGIDPPGGRTVSGGSDGSFTAALGVPTLDGLGAVGSGAHAEGEHILVEAMPERAALVSALVADLRSRSLPDS